ncbi:MAG: JAB domain-containing protein [Saprospiraceae bacterium]|nr:JAB domain-containing protein [Saprospiraceae bacterium]MCB9322965.1 JAB domain-containing protein [Lewinellaceae bacterium]
MTYQIPTQVTEVKLVYYNKVNAKDRPQLKSSFDAYEVLAANWDEGTISLYEEFYILLLDRGNRVMGRYLVSQGGLTGTVVDPKMIFAAALKGRAASIILAHNHPSGNLKPSKADKNLTRNLIQAGKFLEIPVLDHLILAPDGGYYSFADEGEMY